MLSGILVILESSMNSSAYVFAGFPTSGLAPFLLLWFLSEKMRLSFEHSSADSTSPKQVTGLVIAGAPRSPLLFNTSEEATRAHNAGFCHVLHRILQQPWTVPMLIATPH